MKSMSREKALKLIKELNNIVKKEIDVSKYFESELSNADMEEIEQEINFEGVSNGFLSEIVFAVTGYKTEVTGKVEKLFPCPCCGFKTLTELYDVNEGTGYDICPYCHWEDDGTTRIDEYRSINKGSIKEYQNNLRENFNKYYINKWLK
ncbi:MAG: hypothetical protein NC412_10950 [Roseburia sp.]|nr:hypothetical protein [Roseburia sp.]